MAGMRDIASVPRIFTPEYYLRMNELEERAGWYCGMRDITLQLVRRYLIVSERARVMDAGCGTGLLLAQLGEFAGPDGVLVGLDLSSEALRFCRGRKSLLLVKGSLALLPFSQSSFDLIHCADVLQHLEVGQDREALREFFRLLRPGGLVILRVAAGTGVPTLSHRYYQPEEIAETVRALGFEVEIASYINRLSYIAQSLRRMLNPEHDGQGLPLVPPSGPGKYFSLLWWKDLIVSAGLKREARRLARTGRTLRYGMSVICAARKPGRA